LLGGGEGGPLALEERAELVDLMMGLVTYREQVLVTNERVRMLSDGFESGFGGSCPTLGRRKVRSAKSPLDPKAEERPSVLNRGSKR
jgi:hypothetical protein